MAYAAELFSEWLAWRREVGGDAILRELLFGQRSQSGGEEEEEEEEEAGNQNGNRNGDNNDQNGSDGDVIPISNMHSKKIVEAEIIGHGKVAVRAPAQIAMN